MLSGGIWRVSEGVGGAEANEASFTPSISGDGQRVAFASDATNLVDGDTNGLTDVFVFDLATKQLSRISGMAGGPEFGHDPAMSADGMQVAFAAGSGNTIGGEGPVYFQNLATGSLTQVTSSGSNPLENPNPYRGNHPDISGDGRYVSFGHYGDGALVRDVQTGEIVPGATMPDGSIPDIYTTNPTSLSADGRYLLFSTRVSGLVSDDRNGFEDVFVKDLTTGVLTCVSRNENGLVGNGDSFVGDSDGGISDDGRYVVFSSKATNLVAEDDTTPTDLFVKDLTSGEVARFAQTGVVSRITFGRADNDWDPVISGDGRYVAFEARADDFSTGGAAAEENIARQDIFLFRNPLIEDSDTPPPLGTYSIAPTNPTVNEDVDDILSFTITRSDPSTEEIVHVSTKPNWQGSGVYNEGDYVGPP